MAQKRVNLNKVELPVAKIEEKSIGEVTRDAYCDFGYYINTHRHLAGLDGVKISYRRLIDAAMHFPKDKLSPSTTLINYMANTHPHGLASANEMLATLVKSGVCEGEGSWGFRSIDGTVSEAANERYTHSKLSDLYWDLMGDLIKEVPHVESPIGPLEPAYLPLPLPLSLFLKSLSSGLGVGISMIYPNFSAKSLYNAYIHNDPSLLEPNVDLILDKSHSELDKLWKTGKGKVTYSYKISRQLSPDGKSEGILFETKDGTDIFVPKLKEFKKLEEDGKVYIEDMTDIGGSKLFIGRIPNARGITIENIESIARKCCYNTTTYMLNVTNGQTAFRIPLYDWIDYTYKNYINLLIDVNKKRIAKCEFDIQVQMAIPTIADYIINKNPQATDKEIEKVTGISQEIISIVMQKPISYLRKNKDTAGRIKELKDKLKNLKAFDPIKYTEEIINKL